MRLNGWRGAGLLFLSLASALSRGWQYTFDVPHRLTPGLYDLSLDGAVIRGLGVLWIVAAIVGVWSAFRLHDLVGVFALAFMHALWSAALLLGWLFYGGTWLQAVTVFGTFLLIVCWSRMVNPPRADVDLEELLDHERGGE